MTDTPLFDALTHMTVEELTDHIAQATAILARKRDDARSAFIEETRRKAESLGLSLNDLIAEATGKPAGKHAQADKGERRKVSVKYRDPENQENTWTGRGMRPRWLRDKIDAGTTLESFLVEEMPAS